ncbi:MAG: hypothetical protein EOP04_16790 [Proteobacteria bacterium]|nr:MAG: hypothetical protein EOP04_16790 [Pseudomonadota bacterium]
MKIFAPLLIVSIGSLPSCSDSSHSKRPAPGQIPIAGEVEQQLGTPLLNQNATEGEVVEASSPKAVKEEILKTDIPVPGSDTVPVVVSDELKKSDDVKSLISFNFGQPNEVTKSFEDGFHWSVSVLSNKVVSVTAGEADWEGKVVQNYKAEIELADKDFESYLNLARSLSNTDLIVREFDFKVPVCMMYVPGISKRTSLSIRTGYDAEKDVFSGDLTSIHLPQVCWTTSSVLPAQEESKANVEKLEVALQKLVFERFVDQISAQSAENNLARLKTQLSKLGSFEMEVSGMNGLSTYQVDFSKSVLTLDGHVNGPSREVLQKEVSLNDQAVKLLAQKIAAVDLRLSTAKDCNLASDWNNKSLVFRLPSLEEYISGESFYAFAGETNIQGQCKANSARFHISDAEFMEIQKDMDTLLVKSTTKEIVD